MVEDLERIIGRYTGQHRGPLLVCFAGMHGNERAGVEALDLIFKMLEVEPLENPTFEFSGRIIGINGNLNALKKGIRFSSKDMNRQWAAANRDRIFNSVVADLDEEDLEMKDILEVIDQELLDYQPDKMIILDLHTTSAFGGIFTIVNNDPESLSIGVELHAPVITGMIFGLNGTTLHFFTDENFPVRTIAVTFEAGQHYERLSVNRTIAAIINCMRTVGCVRAESVENRHDELLRDFSEGLPKVNELIATHPVINPEKFKLIPGLKNFQKLKEGQLLGYDETGPIIAPEDCLLLMPKYQIQGNDGFFLIKEK